MKRSAISTIACFILLALIVSTNGLTLVGCQYSEPEPPAKAPAPAPLPMSEPPISSHFSTYTDEAGLFSISYPPDWETALFVIEDLEIFVEELIISIDSDIPVEHSGVIFFAGLPTETGYMPNVNIVVESLPLRILTHENMVEAEIMGLKRFTQDYHELSRVNTTIGGREATIIEYEATYPRLGKGNGLGMFTLVGKTTWIVNCTAPPEELSGWREDFDSIARSLRILK